MAQLPTRAGFMGVHSCPMGRGSWGPQLPRDTASLSKGEAREGCCGAGDPSPARSQGPGTLRLPARGEAASVQHSSGAHSSLNGVALAPTTWDGQDGTRCPQSGSRSGLWGRPP